MKRFLFIVLIAAFALTACGVNATSTSRAPIMEAAPAATQAPAAAPAFGSGGGAPESFNAASDAVTNQTSGQQSSANANRLVIKNADLTIVVTDVSAHVKSIETMANAMGGFVVSSNTYQTYAENGAQVPQANIVVRIPADKLDTALDQVKANTVDVQGENVSGQDVTDQYVDLQSQLTAKEAAADQLYKIMQNAQKTQDVLAVYQQLQQIQSDIEVLKGQIKYYEQSAALSSISVTIIAEKGVQPIDIGGWHPQGTARDAIQGLIRFLQGFADFLISFFLRDLWEILLVLLPFYILFLIGRAIFRRFRRNKKPAETPPAEK
ncbi:MAG TPA: DUF4349 domain-containing protein [Anaerolineales bacterium]|nr:DUF4349 domain-containing protein [Anaerolineales bacterium]